MDGPHNAQGQWMPFVCIDVLEVAVVYKSTTTWSIIHQNQKFTTAMYSLLCTVDFASCGWTALFFVCVWPCVRRQPSSNIKISQPMQRLVIIAHRVLVDFLSECVCMPALSVWWCHQSLESAFSLWNKDLCTQADHYPVDLHEEKKKKKTPANYWIYFFWQQKGHHHNL